MIGRAMRISIQGCLGGRRVLWLVVGWVLLWVFAPRLLNPWDSILSVTQENQVVFLTLPLYLLVTNVDLLRPWEALVVTRVASARTWWWGHVLAAGVIAVLLSLGYAVLSGIAAAATGHWSWQWGAYGRHSAYPAVLAQSPWTIPWHWSVDALVYLTLGLWAAGVLRHVLTLWWRGPWLPWLAVVALAFASRALSNTVAQPAVWWLPGTQFSFYYHWTPTGSEMLGWTLTYTTCLMAAAVATGWALAQQPLWQAQHGESL